MTETGLAHTTSSASGVLGRAAVGAIVADRGSSDWRHHRAEDDFHHVDHGEDQKDQPHRASDIRGRPLPASGNHRRKGVSLATGVGRRARTDCERTGPREAQRNRLKRSTSLRAKPSSTSKSRSQPSSSRRARGGVCDRQRIGLRLVGPRWPTPVHGHSHAEPRGLLSDRGAHFHQKQRQAGRGLQDLRNGKSPCDRRPQERHHFDSALPCRSWTTAVAVAAWLLWPACPPLPAGRTA